jgi:hypothetical protein
MKSEETSKYGGESDLFSCAIIKSWEMEGIFI